MSCILFTPQMAIARRERRKSQTRRIVKPQPTRVQDGVCYLDGEPFGRQDRIISCPYGIPGDKLRELTTWATLAAHDHLKPTLLPADAPIWSYYDSDEKPKGFGRLRAGRYLPTALRHHMPLCTLEAARVQRVQEISEEDAKAEGIRAFTKDGELFKHWPNDPLDGPLKCTWQDLPKSPIQAFEALWESVNGPGSWAANPWVWALTLSDGIGCVA